MLQPEHVPSIGKSAVLSILLCSVCVPVLAVLTASFDHTHGSICTSLPSVKVAALGLHCLCNAADCSSKSKEQCMWKAFVRNCICQKVAVTPCCPAVLAELWFAWCAGVNVALTLVNVVVVIQGLPAVSVPAVSASPSPVPVLPSDGSSASTKSAGISIGAVAGGAAGGVLALGQSHFA